MNELDWKQPALVGGLIAGILSSIPLVNLANCCFCAWLLVGGAVATKMLVNRAPRPVRGGEGAQVGAIAGLIAAGVYLAINIPMILFGVGEEFQRQLLEQMAASLNVPELQEELRKAIEESINQTPAQRLVSTLPFLIISAVLFVGFTTLGGLLGVALFEKRRGQPPPQYPSGYPPQYPPNYPPNYPPQSGGPGGDRGGWPQG
jgi:hypothetical protein